MAIEAIESQVTTDSDHARPSDIYTYYHSSRSGEAFFSFESKTTLTMKRISVKITS